MIWAIFLGIVRVLAVLLVFIHWGDAHCDKDTDYAPYKYFDWIMGGVYSVVFFVATFIRNNYFIFPRIALWVFVSWNAFILDMYSKEKIARISKVMEIIVLVLYVVAGILEIIY